MSNTPKLRFPEFNGEWEKKRLEEICDPPKYGLNSAGIEFDGIHKYLRITDIDEITHTFSPTDITTPSEFNDEYLLNKNDIVFARTGASTGKTYLYDSNDGDLYFAGFLIKFHVKNANARFVFYQTLTHKYSKWVHVMSTRSGQPGINSEEYGSYKIKLPDIHEQQKIADFLSNVDSIITAETKILNALQKKKKALMQKLFTQQLRFKSDDGKDFPAWEEKKVIDFAKVDTGVNNTQDKVEDGPYPFYVRSPIIYRSNKYIFDFPEAVLTVGDGVGTGKVFHYVQGKFDCHQRVYVIHDFENVLGKYFYFYFSEKFYARVKPMSAKNSVDSVRREMITDMKIPIPCKTEQQKIADCLSSMDSLIQTQQKVITTWQQRKKALLQLMFI